MKCLTSLLIALLFIAGAHAQQPGWQHGSPDEQGDAAPFYFFQAVNLVADDSTKSRVDILYRVDEQFFIAVKNTDTPSAFPFKRRGEISVELLDKDDVSRARETHHFESGARSSETSPEQKSWHEGHSSFTVRPGEYTIVFEVTDLESERHSLDKNRKIVARNYDSLVLESSTPLFVHHTGTTEPRELTPINAGGNIMFGKDASLFIQLHSRNLTNKPVRIEYSIATHGFSLQEPQVVLSDTLESLLLLRNCMLTPGPDSLSYVVSAPRSATNTAAILLPLHADQLPLRPFLLKMKIKQGLLETSIELPFRSIWPEMPLSLRDIDFALDALRYITRESELDSLRSGGREERLKHLEEFWKTKDPTQKTEYNEVMVEYYRRVDYTMRTFSSLRGGDGFKTDRGRVYILYGPPTRTDRSLNASTGYQEVWIYEKQGKKFVFVDQSKSGNYTLVATQNLD